MSLALAALALGIGGDVLAGSKTIDAKSIAADLFALSRVEMQGRDSPSAALERAAQIISTRMAELGYEPAADAREQLAPFLEEDSEDGASEVEPNLYLRPFTRGLEAPVPEECSFLIPDDGVGVVRGAFVVWKVKDFAIAITEGLSLGSVFGVS